MEAHWFCQGFGVNQANCWLPVAGYQDVHGDSVAMNLGAEYDMLPKRSQRKKGGQISFWPLHFRSRGKLIKTRKEKGSVLFVERIEHQ